MVGSCEHGEERLGYLNDKDFVERLFPSQKGLNGFSAEDIPYNESYVHLFGVESNKECNLYIR